MTAVDRSKTWLQRNGFNIIITLLLGIITYGGREAVGVVKDFIKSQNEINKTQNMINLEVRDRTNECFRAAELMKSVNETNQEQGVVLMQHGEELIEHEVRIEHLESHNDGGNMN